MRTHPQPPAKKTHAREPGCIIRPYSHEEARAAIAANPFLGLNLRPSSEDLDEDATPAAPSITSAQIFNIIGGPFKTGQVRAVDSRSLTERTMEALQSGPMETVPLAEAIGCDPQVLRTRLDKAVRSGKIVRHGVRGHMRYALPDQSQTKDEPTGVALAGNPQQTPLAPTAAVSFRAAMFSTGELLITQGSESLELDVEQTQQLLHYLRFIISRDRSDKSDSFLPAPSPGLRCALYSTGEFEISALQRTITLGVDQTRALCAYLDRLDNPD
jgi:hypothetical protein